MSVCCGAVEETGHLDCAAKVRWNGMMTGGGSRIVDAAEKDLARVCWNMETGGGTHVAVVPLARVRQHDRVRGCGAVQQHAVNGNGWDTDHLGNNTETSSREATDQVMIHHHLRHRRLTTRTVRQEARRIGPHSRLKRQTRVS